MARRAVPAGLVVAAAFADASGSASVAFYALLGLVLAAAVTALRSYGELVEAPPPPEEEAPRRLQTLLWGMLVVVAVAGTAARAPALGEGVVPPLGTTTVVACLILLCVEGIVELVAQARKRPLRRPRPGVTASEG